MRLDTVCRRLRAAGLAVLVVAAALCGPAAAQAQRGRGTNVDKLRVALDDPNVETRKENLLKRTAALVTLGEMSKGMLLSNWRIAEPGAVGQVDSDVFNDLSKRFQDRARDVLKTGSPAERTAVTNLIGDMAITERKASIANPSLEEKLIEMAPALAEASKDSRAPEVQVSAATSLAELQADPGVTVKALAALLTSGNARVEKAAADGLALFIQIASQRSKSYTGRGAPGQADRLRKHLLDSAVLIIQPGGLALGRDQPLEVRRAGADALRQVAATLREAVQDASRESDLESLRNTVAALSRPAMAFEQLADSLSGALADPDPVLRLRAIQVLEEMSDGLRQFKELSGRGTSPPGAAPAPAERGLPGERLLRATLPAVTAALSDPNVQVRRTAVNVLEWMGQDARGALPGLVGALRDADVFVRWSAARTLGALAARAEEGSPLSDADMDRVVRSMTRLLGGEEDLSARMAVLTAFERIGPRAEAAVPVLWATVNRGDPSSRVNTLHALQSIGTAATVEGPAGAIETASGVSLPPLARALADPDASVRRAAAETMGEFASALKPEEKGSKLYRLLADPNSDVRIALARLLRDPDTDVSRAASEAILQARR
jgi:HEAT repeat protein